MDLYDELFGTDEPQAPYLDVEGEVADYERAPVQARRQVNQWEPRLVMDLALNLESTEDILERYGLTRHDYDALMGHPVFRRELALTIREMRENGASFSKKAAVQAEEYLADVDRLVSDAATPASVKLECIKSVVKWGRLDGLDRGDVGVERTVVNVNISI